MVLSTEGRSRQFSICGRRYKQEGMHYNLPVNGKVVSHQQMMHTSQPLLCKATRHHSEHMPFSMPCSIGNVLAVPSYEATIVLHRNAVYDAQQLSHCPLAREELLRPHILHQAHGKRVLGRCKVEASCYRTTRPQRCGPAHEQLGMLVEPHT